MTWLGTTRGLGLPALRTRRDERLLDLIQRAGELASNVYVPGFQFSGARGRGDPATLVVRGPVRLGGLAIVGGTRRFGVS